MKIHVFKRIIPHIFTLGVIGFLFTNSTSLDNANSNSSDNLSLQVLPLQALSYYSNFTKTDVVRNETLNLREYFFAGDGTNNKMVPAGGGSIPDAISKLSPQQVQNYLNDPSSYKNFENSLISANTTFQLDHMSENGQSSIVLKEGQTRIFLNILDSLQNHSDTAFPEPGSTVSYEDFRRQAINLGGDIENHALIFRGSASSPVELAYQNENFITPNSNRNSGTLGEHFMQYGTGNYISNTLSKDVATSFAVSSAPKNLNLGNLPSNATSNYDNKDRLFFEVRSATKPDDISCRSYIYETHNVDGFKVPYDKLNPPMGYLQQEVVTRDLPIDQTNVRHLDIKFEWQKVSIDNLWRVTIPTNIDNPTYNKLLANNKITESEAIPMRTYIENELEVGPGNISKPTQAVTYPIENISGFDLENPKSVVSPATKMGALDLGLQLGSIAGDLAAQSVKLKNAQSPEEVNQIVNEAVNKSGTALLTTGGLALAGTVGTGLVIAIGGTVSSGPLVVGGGLLTLAFLPITIEQMSTKTFWDNLKTALNNPTDTAKLGIKVWNISLSEAWNNIKYFSKKDILSNITKDFLNSIKDKENANNVNNNNYTSTPSIKGLVSSIYKNSGNSQANIKFNAKNINGYNKGFTAGDLVGKKVEMFLKSTQIAKTTETLASKDYKPTVRDRASKVAALNQLKSDYQKDIQILKNMQNTINSSAGSVAGILIPPNNTQQTEIIRNIATNNTTNSTNPSVSAVDPTTAKNYVNGSGMSPTELQQRTDSFFANTELSGFSTTNSNSKLQGPMMLVPSQFGYSLPVEINNNDPSQVEGAKKIFWEAGGVDIIFENGDSLYAYIKDGIVNSQYWNGENPVFSNNKMDSPEIVNAVETHLNSDSKETVTLGPGILPNNYLTGEGQDLSGQYQQNSTNSGGFWNSVESTISSWSSSLSNLLGDIHSGAVNLISGGSESGC